MNLYGVKGFVLRKQAFRENGFLVDLFTRELGQITVLVRSNRNQKKQQSLELFSLATWHIKEGRNFYFLDNYELVTSYSLKGREIWTAYYLNELLIRLFPKFQLDPILFDSYQKVLISLYEKNQYEQLLRRFECDLLAFLGILPDFGYDADGELIDEKRIYFVHAERGIINNKIGSAFEITGVLLLKIRMQSPLETDEAQQFKQLMRYLFAPLLGGRPLQSRIWLQKLYYRS